MEASRQVGFLWMSNAPWAGTGYGQQTGLILKALKEIGHDPTCFAFYGLSGGALEYDGYPVLPNSDYNMWGNDVVKAHAARASSECVVTLMDLFVLDRDVWGSLPIPWIAWVPIDHESIGMPTSDMLEMCQYPVAMSHFGAEQMREIGIEPAATIYHAVDTDVFYQMDKRECRQRLELEEDAFIVGMVMANKGDRKRFPQQLEAVRKWADQYPERKVRVYLHTEPTDKMSGWNMRQLVAKVGLQGMIYATNHYDASVVPFPHDMMATVYNCFDVLMNVSGGEGFGIPIIEAQACGVPVLTGDWTSMPELTQNGYAIKPIARHLAPHYGYHFLPDVEDMVYRLECVYRKDSQIKRDFARQWVENHCSVPVIAAQWDELLGTVIERARELGATPASTSRPQFDLPTQIVLARQAMREEMHEYGDYNARRPEYQIVAKGLSALGLENGDRILDLGAGLCDLDRFLRENGWWGTYSPVDMMIDGTNLENYRVPDGYDFVVIEQTIEHLDNPWWLLGEVKRKAAVGIVITTPNGQVVPSDEKADYPHQMAHKVWLTPEDFHSQGFETTLAALTGRPNDTIIAIWAREDEPVEEKKVEVSVGDR